MIQFIQKFWVFFTQDFNPIDNDFNIFLLPEWSWSLFFILMSELYRSIVHHFVIST